MQQIVMTNIANSSYDLKNGIKPDNEELKTTFNLNMLRNYVFWFFALSSYKYGLQRVHYISDQAKGYGFDHVSADWVLQTKGEILSELTIFRFP